MQVEKLISKHKFNFKKSHKKISIDLTPIKIQLLY